MNSNSEILNLIKHIIVLPLEEEEKFLKLLKPLSIAKGDFYIREGQVPTKFAFVTKGLFRYLYIDAKGNEFTKNFIAEGAFITSYSSMISKSPSIMYIQALEDSHVSEINYSEWSALKNGHPCWNHFLLYVLEKAFYTKEKRERDLLLLDAQARYELFKQEHQALEPRIKQHLIASYLGITPISLSRLKNKIQS